MADSLRRDESDRKRRERHYQSLFRRLCVLCGWSRGTVRGKACGRGASHPGHLPTEAPNARPLCQGRGQPWRDLKQE